MKRVNRLRGFPWLVRGTSRGTVTNSLGVFTIDAEVGETLEFSIVGYATSSVRVGQGNSVSVQLSA